MSNVVHKYRIRIAAAFIVAVAIAIVLAVLAIRANRPDNGGKADPGGGPVDVAKMLTS